MNEENKRDILVYYINYYNYVCKLKYYKYIKVYILTVTNANCGKKCSYLYINWHIDILIFI